MSNNAGRPDLGPGCACASLAGRGGEGAPARPASSQIRPLPMPAQFFKIPDEGEPALQRLILEKISFHFAVFPFFSIPDSTEH